MEAKKKFRSRAEALEYAEKIKEKYPAAHTNVYTKNSRYVVFVCGVDDIGDM